MGLDACGAELIEQLAVGDLAGADHDGVGFDHPRHAVDQDVQPGIVDPLDS